MKKSLLFLSAIVLTVLLVTGCGSKKVLSCSISGTQSGVKYYQDMDATFNGNKVTKIYMKMAFDISEFPESYKSTLESSMKTTYENMYKKEGSTVKVETKGNDILVYIDMDLDKMSEADKAALNVVDTKGTYSATKLDMEKSGYTCK